MKIIDAYKKIFGNDKTIEIASNVLSQYRNVSSVSVLLSLREILQNKLIGNFLMSALGPGLPQAYRKLRYMDKVGIILMIYLIILRILELFLSKYNTEKLIKDGAKEFYPFHYKFIVVFHSIFLAFS